jgi:hypothetical protein
MLKTLLVRNVVLLALTAFGVGYGALELFAPSTLSAQTGSTANSIAVANPEGGDCCSGDWCFASDKSCTGNCGNGLKQCPK